MNNSVELLTNTSSVWILEDPALINREFALGFLYGGMFLFKQLPVDSEPYFKVRGTAFNGDEDNVPHRIRSVDQLYDFADIFNVELEQVQADMERYTKVPGKYAIMLVHPKYNGEFILFHVESPIFLQGLFTPLKAGNIPYDQVLLHNPIKDGVAYNIQGLNLPNLEDIQ